MLSLRIKILLCILLILFTYCDITDPVIEEEYTFFEGEQIPGTEIFFPLGFYGTFARPKVSPDGNFIVYKDLQYLIDPSIQPGLYILDLTTLEKRLLVEGFAYSPDWSPDGEWIAFNFYPQIYKIKADGSNLTKLTSEGNNFSVDWSPDGKWIAYNRSFTDSSGPWGIWVMKNDGSEKRWIGNGSSPSWHFSNHKIVGKINESVNGSQSFWKLIFYHINPDSMIEISQFKYRGIINPEYSPDGSRITFYSQDIWISNADGNSPKRILTNYIPDKCCETESGLGISPASWYPDSEYLIYEHFKVTRYENPQPGFGPFIEGYYSFYKVNVDSALAISNLP